MLYSTFRIIIMFAACMGTLHMVMTSSFIYIFFPISIIIWGVFSFFDENDKEYIRRNECHQNSSPSLFSKYQPKSYYDSKQEYKNIAAKCKRSIKITLEK